jgi:16S rRNA (uracil1498-N3)-methyltransferase
MNQVFYTPPDNIIGEWVTIKGSEAHHLRNVMRARKGDSIMVVDGVGNGYKSVIEKRSPKEISCRVLSRVRHFGEPMVHVTLAAGLSTGYKFDEVIQRGTELGVCRFIPLLTEMSKVKMDSDRREKAKLARWSKVAVASMKQTGRSFLPEIEPIRGLVDVFNIIDETAMRILFDSSHGSRRLEDLEIPPETKNYTLFVGPESGFSRIEIELARENSCSIMTLGRRALRTQNASPVAVAILMHILGELR